MFKQNNYTISNVFNNIINFIIKNQYQGLINESKRHKELGNQYFKEKKYNKALEEYNQAADICPNSQKEDLAIYYNNMAACYVYIVS